MHDLDRSYFLQAAAGTGKTSILVARVVEIIRQGRATIDQVAAISFTEMASSEVRGRIREALHGELGGPHGTRAEAALGRLDAAHVETIHAFASGILREYPLAAGIHPDFQQLDDVAADVDFTERLDHWLGSAQGPARDAIDAGRELGLGFDHIRRIARTLAANRGLAPAEAGRVINQPGLAATSQAEDSTSASVSRRQRSLQQLCTTIIRFVEDAAADRRHSGVLTFDDLLIEAARVVSEDAAVLDGLRRRFRYLLVDEFQDTDPRQASLIFLIASDAGPRRPGERVDWRTAPPRPGAMFLVGDPQQSIYRFRGADIDTFRAVRSRLLADPGTRVVRISGSFRSSPPIIDWLNRTFAAAIGEEYVSLTARRQATGGIAYLVPDEPLGGRRMADVRTVEAEDIARFIRAAMHSDRWSIRAKDGPRRLRYGDICVLVTNRYDLERYTEAFARHRIPYRQDRGRDFSRRQEIRDLAAVLGCIDDPGDQLSLLAAMRSICFAISDRELADHVARGGAWSYLQPDPPHGPVAEAFSRLAGLYRRKAHLPVGRLVAEVVREMMLVETLLALFPSHPQRAAAVRLIVERAASLESGPAANSGEVLRELVAWLRRNDDDVRSDPEAQVTDDDADVVRVLTVHGAKGLEFPMVILAKLAGRAATEPTTCVEPGAGRIELAVRTDPPVETPGFADMIDSEKAHQAAERARRLYVAASRARDWLVVPVYRPDTYPGDLELLAASVPGEGVPVSSTNERLVPAARIPRHAAEMSVPPAINAERLIERFEARRQARSNRVVVQASILPSSSTIEETWQVAGSGRSAAPDTPSVAALEPIRSREQARDVGTLVHRALHAADFHDLEGTRDRTQRLLGGIDAEITDQVISHVGTILKSPFARVIRAADALHREVPVRASTEDGAISGIVDLLFRRDPGSGWILVDYKTDRADAPTLVERYRRQLELYRAALARSGVTVAGMTIWKTTDGTEVEIGE